MNDQGLLRREKTETKTQKISEELGNDRSQIQLANEDIKKLESVVEEGTHSYIRLR